MAESRQCKMGLSHGLEMRFTLAGLSSWSLYKIEDAKVDQERVEEDVEI